MSFVTAFFVFCCFYGTFSQDSSAADACRPYGYDEAICNNHQFTVSGYGSASCTYVLLTSVDSEYPARVCLPDHCGLFANDETRCQDDTMCNWENGHCLPVCFNKIDIMFLVDGSASNLIVDYDGNTYFDKYLDEIQEYVAAIPEKGNDNQLHNVREAFISFGGQQMNGGYVFPQTLDFINSESLNQEDAAAAVLDLSLTPPGGNTNIRRALAEVNSQFTNSGFDHEKFLFIISDGAATESEYLEFSFPQLGINDFSDVNLRRSLGFENCDRFGAPTYSLCTAVQYFDLGDIIYDPLGVDSIFFLLGNETLSFSPSMTANGPLFASRFVDNDPTRLIRPVNKDYDLSVLNLPENTLSNFARNIDASICEPALRNDDLLIDSACSRVSLCSTVNTITPDSDVIDDIIQFSLPNTNSASFNSIKVRVTGSHSYHGDFVMKLFSPNNLELTLLFNTGGSTSGDFDVTFADVATVVSKINVNGAERRPHSGTFVSVFSGTEIIGDWKLEISDVWEQDTGFWEEWCITEICWTQ